VKVWEFTFGPICAGSITIAATTVIHLFKAAVLAWTQQADGGIGLTSLLREIDGFPSFGLLSQEHNVCLLLVASSALALYAMHSRSMHHMAVCALLIPQQTLLIITCIGAISAVVQGHYADGYEPNGGGWFIFADQIWRIIMAPAYTVALLARAHVVEPS
jgi:hypothetical protein